jgi:hypothetical protein
MVSFHIASLRKILNDFGHMVAGYRKFGRDFVGRE